LVLISMTTLCFASEGDTDPFMRTCRLRCSEERSCRLPDNAFERKAPFWLKLFAWDCESDCEYQCMRNHTIQRKKSGLNVLQYHGKWPFIRVLGMQELFSSVFSLGNAIPNAIYFFKVKSNVPDGYYLKKILLLFASIHVITWIFSTIFHARDVKVTEALDYYFSDIAWGFICVWTTIRVFDLRSKLSIFFVFLFFGALVTHLIYYLTYVKFDYGYNTLVGLGMASWQSALWFYWSFRNYKKKIFPMHGNLLLVRSVRGSQGASRYLILHRFGTCWMDMQFGMG